VSELVNSDTRSRPTTQTTTKFGVKMGAEQLSRTFEEMLHVVGCEGHPHGGAKNHVT
jgi:hypothetical protein